MDQCDKQKSAIGDHDVFEYPMGNRTPQELTPYVFNWKYEDATLKRHYPQAAAVVEDWLREAHKSYPQTLTNLLSNVSARPLGSCHDKDDPDSEIKAVLSLISKYQFQYRRPSKSSYEAALDEWPYKSEFHKLPRNLTTNEFHVLPNEFMVHRLLCPGSWWGQTNRPLAMARCIRCSVTLATSGGHATSRASASLCICGGFATLTP